MEYQKVIEQNGGIWKGIQEGIPAEKGYPAIESIILFDIPGTGGATAGLNISNFSPKNIKEKIIQKQKEFQKNY